MSYLVQYCPLPIPGKIYFFNIFRTYLYFSQNTFGTISPTKHSSFGRKWRSEVKYIFSIFSALTFISHRIPSEQYRLQNAQVSAENGGVR